MPDIFTSPTDSAPQPSASPSMMTGLTQAFSSFLHMPQGMRFETQSEDEIIYLLLRKHWITNIIWILTGIMLILLPFLLVPLISFGGLLPLPISDSFLGVLVLIWYLITLTYLLNNFLLWYFTVSIVTQERVIDVDFINLLNKRYSETRISKVEDVTMHAGGFLKAFFDYGDVLVQTAASAQEFEFISVPHPERVVRIINELLENIEELGGKPE